MICKTSLFIDTALYPFHHIFAHHKRQLLKLMEEATAEPEGYLPFKFKTPQPISLLLSVLFEFYWSVSGFWWGIAFVFFVYFTI